jgi:drug/metabolite transporter (DMT)-like permease
MSLGLFFLGLLCVLSIAVGQIMFKTAAESISLDSLQSFALSIAFNKTLIAALVLYGVTTVLWVIFLKFVELRLAYPIMALAFIFVPIMSRMFLYEPISVRTIIGGAVIGIGIAISVY